MSDLSERPEVAVIRKALGSTNPDYDAAIYALDSLADDISRAEARAAAAERERDEAREDVARCAADTTAVELRQEIEFIKAEHARAVECLCGHSESAHDEACYGDKLVAPGSFVPCECEQFIPAWARWQERAVAAEARAAAAEKELRDYRAWSIASPSERIASAGAQQEPPPPAELAPVDVAYPGLTADFPDSQFSPDVRGDKT